MNLRVETTRGDLIESVSSVSVAVADADGHLLAWAGEPRRVTHLRSAAKPFQAVPLIQDGVVDRFGITTEELALACASHNSESEQVSRVVAWLERLDLGERHLACGPHRPLSRDLALPEVEPRHERHRRLTPVMSNCSGKHTGMLALAKAHGWPTAGYHEAAHPVQRRMLRAMAEYAGVDPGEIRTAVDGCGVLTFAIPLVAAARAFAQLVAGAARADPAASAVVGAMVGHPDLVAGRGRLDTAVLRVYGGQVIAKVGAEGVYGAAVASRGLGVALKVEDGSAWAAIVALVAVLDQLGVTPPASNVLAAFARRPVRNTRGETVGETRPAGALTFV